MSINDIMRIHIVLFTLWVLICGFASRALYVLHDPAGSGLAGAVGALGLIPLFMLLCREWRLHCKAQGLPAWKFPLRFTLPDHLR